MTEQNRIRWIATTCAAIALAAALVWLAMAGVDTGRTVLVAPGTWSNPVDFLVAPPTGTLPAVYPQPAAPLWRNWAGGAELRKGEGWTGAFMPSQIVGIPVHGNLNQISGNRALIECTTDGRRRAIAHLEVFANWSFVLVDAQAFCPGPVRVGAVSEGRELLGIGTPVSVSNGEAFALRYLFPAGGAMLALVIVGAVWIAASIGWVGLGVSGPAVASFGLLSTGLAALATFWAFSISPVAGRAAVAAVLLSAALTMLRAAGSPARPFHDVSAQLAGPFAAWSVFGLAILALGGAIDNGGGAFAANTAFFPVTWSTDNQLPVELADALAAGIHPSKITFGHWLASDRPPLLSGYLLLVHGLVALLTPSALRYASAIGTQASGVVLMALWAPAAWIGLRLARVRDDAIIPLLIVIGISGFCIFNGLYTWPKLLAAAFGLLMILALARLSSRTGEVGDSPVVLLSIAALGGALALLSHGGALFGVVAALLVCARPIFRQGPRPMLLAALAGIAVLTPWLIWQAWFQPNGTALLRFLLVGSFGFDRRETSVLAEAVNTYASLGWSKFLLMKWDAIRTVFGAPTHYCNNVQKVGSLWTSAPLDTTRVNEFYYLAFMTGLPVLAGTIASMHRSGATERSLCPVLGTLAAIGAVSVLIWIPVTWDCHIVHHFSYQSCLAIMIAGWGAALARGGGERWLALASVVSALAAWVASPLAQAITIRWGWFIVFLLALALPLTILGSWILRYDGSRQSTDRRGPLGGTARYEQ
jgi:hypothetical protein